MMFLNAILIILGLALFEVVSSIDNAVINAEILDTMSPRGRRWFLLWGFVFAVFAVRGLLPWLIVWGVNPALGPGGSFLAAFSNDPHVAISIAQSSPILLLGGGMFLIFLFVHWLFLEQKQFGLPHEKFFLRNGVWFYGVILVILCAVVWFSRETNPMMAFSAGIGASVFFIMQGFKSSAEQAEEKMLAEKSASGMRKHSDFSKIAYLEIIDASFSIDGVLGAFAFTLCVPYILIGSGLGAFVLRRLTIRNIDRIKKYVYLKNGAMYAIGALSVVMILEAFGRHIDVWVSPLIMVLIVGYFFMKSRKLLLK